MKLKQADLENIGQRVDANESLENILKSEFPHANISIIKGVDNSSLNSYIQAAFFDKKQAQNHVDTMNSSGTQENTIYVINGTIMDLETGRFFDKKDSQIVFFTEEDKDKIYDSLRNKINRLGGALAHQYYGDLGAISN